MEEVVEHVLELLETEEDDPSSRGIGSEGGLTFDLVPLVSAYKGYAMCGISSVNRQPISNTMDCIIRHNSFNSK